jgi:molecular chaperone HscB
VHADVMRKNPIGSDELTHPQAAASEPGGTHFQLFGLPAAFAIDPGELELRCRRLQAQLHPDRHASGSERDRLVSTQWTMRINEAYAILKEPASRARYLLVLQGQDPLADRRGSDMPAEFLMSQLVWREAIEHARKECDTRGLERIAASLRSEMRADIGQLEQLIDVQANYVDAAHVARRLSFLGKVCADIAALIDELDA